MRNSPASAIARRTAGVDAPVRLGRVGVLADQRVQRAGGPHGVHAPAPYRPSGPTPTSDPRAGRATVGRDQPGEDGSGDEVGAEGRQDRQVQQAGGGHHRRVVALLERGAGDEHQHDRRHRARRPEPAEHAVPAVVDRAGEHREHPDGQQQRDDLDRPGPAEGAHQVVEVAAGQARLDEVPVTEQHRVGHRAEEQRRRRTCAARHRPVAAGVERGGQQPGDGDDRGDEVECRRELPARRHAPCARR